MDIPRPGPQQNLHETLRRAFEELKKRDASDLARECGGTAHGAVVEVECLGRTLAVDVAGREVRLAEGEGGSGPRVDDSLAAVAARYVMLAGRLPREPGAEIGFADWPDARNYAGPFRGRALGALIGAFGRDPEAFAGAAAKLGGKKVEVEASRAVASRLRVFPRVTVTVILHPGDEELPADAQMVFAQGVFQAFAPDDVVAFGELAAKALGGRLWDQGRPESGRACC